MFFYAKRKENKQNSRKKKVKPSRYTDWLDYQVKVVKIDMQVRISQGLSDLSLLVETTFHSLYYGV